MPESVTTREAYSEGSIKDFLELLMLGNNKINKELIAFVIKSIPKSKQAHSEWFLSEIRQELEAISVKVSDGEQLDFKSADPIIRKIQAAELQKGELNENIVLGEN